MSKHITAFPLKGLGSDLVSYQRRSKQSVKNASARATQIRSSNIEKQFRSIRKYHTKSTHAQLESGGLLFTAAAAAAAAAAGKHWRCGHSDHEQERGGNVATVGSKNDWNIVCLVRSDQLLSNAGQQNQKHSPRPHQS